MDLEKQRDEEHKAFWDSMETLPDDPKDLEEFQKWIALQGEPTKEDLINSLEAIFLRNKYLEEEREILIGKILELHGNRASVQEFIQTLTPKSSFFWLMDWRTGVLLVVAVFLALCHFVRGWLSK